MRVSESTYVKLWAFLDYPDSAAENGIDIVPWKLIYK